MGLSHSPDRGRGGRRDDSGARSTRSGEDRDGRDGVSSGLDDSSAAEHAGEDEGGYRGRMIGRLDVNAYSNWGGPSRSNSVSGDDVDVACCKGGPSKPKCGQPVTDGDDGVMCLRCSCWYHRECEGVSKVSYKAMGKHTRLSFICTPCTKAMETKDRTRKGAPPPCKCLELQNQVEQLEGLIGANADMIKKALQAQSSELNAKLDQLTGLIGANKELAQKALLSQEKVASEQTKMIQATLKETKHHSASYADAVKGSCVDVVEKVTAKIDALPKPGPNTSSNTAQEVAGVLDDFMAKEKKKLNVIVHNMKESTNTSHYSRCDEDGSTFRNIVREELKINVKVTNAYRVGKKVEGKPRLLVISLEDVDTKHEILKVASQLRDSADWSNVYITPDLTWKEREVGRKLREDLARRRANGEENLFIKQGKIVHGTRPRPNGPGNSWPMNNNGRQEPGAQSAQEPEAQRVVDTDAPSDVGQMVSASPEVLEAPGPASINDAQLANQRSQEEQGATATPESAQAAQSEAEAH